MSFNVERGFLEKLARASAEVIRPRFLKPDLPTELKSDVSPVTEADREAERVMREMIEARFPDHGILGEELGTVREHAEYVWVLDPIDGTKSFITGVPLFGTLIGLLHRGVAVLGCIHQPILNQLLIGDGRVTTMNGSVVRVRPCSRVEDAVLLTTDPLAPGRNQNGVAFEALAQRARVYRTFGDAYGYLLVASGWADVMVDPIMKPWDLLPLIPVLEGAGVVVTDWQGRPANRLDATSCIAAGPGLHGAVVGALNPGRGGSGGEGRR